MSRLGIQTGSNPNDGQGDPLRIAMGKINSNFTEIYNTIGDGNNLISYASTAGISTLARNLTGSPRINVSGILNTGITTTEHLEVRNITSTGIITALQFVGDGSQLENVVATNSGVEVLDENVRKGVAKELNFGAGLFCSGPDGVGRVTIAVTTSIVSGGGTGGGTPLEIRNQNVILGEYSKLNFGANLLAYVNPVTGVVTVTTATSGLNISGIITATSFRGSGSSLTGVITSLVGYATTGYVASALVGYTTTGYVTNALVGYATTGYVASAISAINIPTNLNDLTDVNVGAPSTGQVLKWSGTEWQAAPDLTASGLGIGLSDLSVTINPAGINSLTYNNSTGIFNFTPTNLTGFVTTGGSIYYASIAGIATVGQGLTGTPDITVNDLEVIGVTTFYNSVHFDYDKLLLIGSNDELQLFHNGTNSYIDNSSGGSLIIRDSGLGIQLRRSGGGPGAGLMANFNTGGGVELYYDSVLKFQTFQNGVAINDSLGIGTTAGNPPYRLTVSGVGATITQGLVNAIADFTSSVNGYGQLNVRNSLSGTNASGDVVITANTGSDTSNFIDLGINNTGFTTSSWTINGALDGYLYTSDSNLSIGAASASKYLSLFAGGTLAANEQVRVTTTGVGIGTTNVTSKLTVGGDVRVSGVITASYFVGDGSLLTNVPGSANSGYANTAGIATVAQGLTGTPNITVGVVTATSYIGSGSSLTGLTGASANTYGNATAVPQIVVDANGRISSITNVLISGGGGGGSSIIVNDSGSLVGSAGTIDFGAGISVTPASAGIVTANVTYSPVAGYSTSSGVSTSATTAGYATIAGYSTSSGVSTSATTAGYASTAGISTVAQGLTGTPNIAVGVVTATSYTGSGVNLTGVITSLVAGTNVTITQTAGIATISATGGGGGGSGDYATIAGYSTSSGIATYATSSGIATNAGISTSVIGGVGIITQLSVSAITTTVNLNVTGIGTFLTAGLKVRNPANTFQYNITSGAITADRTLNLPVITATDTLAVLGLSQTFTAVQSFSNTLTASATLDLTGNTTGTHVFGSNQTTGTITLGGASGTGTITFGRATTSQQTDIQTGITASGNTKTINLGTNGASGSFTRISVGPTAGVGTVIINSGANLGIGSTLPTSNIDVVGNGKFTGIVTASRFDSVTAGTPIIESTDTISINTPKVAISTDLTVGGNTGIGTTNATSKLHVLGNVLVSGVTTITGNLNAPGNYYVKLARLTNQTVLNGADALIGFSTISDPNNWYSGITTRTTPTVAGTYRVDVMLNWNAGSVTNDQTNIQIRKNGTTFALSQTGIHTFAYTQNACGIVTMNGTTDYIDFTVYTSNPTSQVVTGTADGAWTKMEIFKIN